MDSTRNYTLERVIGEGAFSKVLVATHKVTGKRVAIKTIDKTKITSHDDTKAVRRERRILPQIKHPNIIHIFGAVEVGQYLQFFGDFYENGDLLTFVQKSGGRLEEKLGRKMFIQVASALDFLHRNYIIHRDVKLENVLLDTTYSPKLGDFGFARVYFKNRKIENESCGSLSYSSPEICLGKPYYGPEVDVWSLGVMLYAMIAGRMPFSGHSEEELKNKIVESLYTCPDSFSPELVDFLDHFFSKRSQEPETGQALEGEQSEEIGGILPSTIITKVERLLQHKWVQIDGDETPKLLEYNRSQKIEGLDEEREEEEREEKAEKELLLQKEKQRQKLQEIHQEQSQAKTSPKGNSSQGTSPRDHHTDESKETSGPLKTEGVSTAAETGLIDTIRAVKEHEQRRDNRSKKSHTAPPLLPPLHLPSESPPTLLQSSATSPNISLSQLNPTSPSLAANPKKKSFSASGSIIKLFGLDPKKSPTASSTSPPPLSPSSTSTTLSPRGDDKRSSEGKSVKAKRSTTTSLLSPRKASIPSPLSFNPTTPSPPSSGPQSPSSNSPPSTPSTGTTPRGTSKKSLSKKEDDKEKKEDKDKKRDKEKEREKEKEKTSKTPREKGISIPSSTHTNSPSVSSSPPSSRASKSTIFGRK